jgi:cell division protein FtsN
VTDSTAWAKKGQFVTIVAKDIPEKGGVWYRVVLGRYSGRAEAQAAADNLRAAGSLADAAVVSLPAR